MLKNCWPEIKRLFRDSQFVKINLGQKSEIEE